MEEREGLLEYGDRLWAQSGAVELGRGQCCLSQVSHVYEVDIAAKFEDRLFIILVN